MNIKNKLDVKKNKRTNRERERNVRESDERFIIEYIENKSRR